MPNKKFSGMILCATGIILLILSLISDFLRGKQFFLGMAQIGLMSFGFLLFAIGILIVNNHTNSFALKVTPFFLGIKKFFGVIFHKINNTREIDRRIPVIAFLFLTLFSSSVLAYLKIDTFNSWRYSSDLFSFHTAIQETAIGNFGLEFTYGSAFGDHSYLFLILLAPFKYLFGSNTIYLLLLSGPLLLGVSSTIFFFTTRQLVGQWKAFSLSIIYLLGFSHTYRGLFEDTYGMHPDTYAGYLAVAMTSLLIWKYQNETVNKRAVIQTFGVYTFFLLFIVQKEEMALLAIIYFLIVWLLHRSPFQRNLLFLSLLVFGADAAIIRFFHSPFNVTLNSRIPFIIQMLKERGLGFFFTNPKGEVDLHLSYYTVMLLCIMSFFIILKLSKQLNPYVVGLFIIGIFKMAFAIVVWDFNLITWHNFPALVMVITAILQQLALLENNGHKVSQWLLPVLLSLSIASLILYEIPYVLNQFSINAARKPLVNQLTPELNEIQKQIDPSAVVAVPGNSQKPWIRYRYSLYPRGIHRSPVGIADYIVFPYNEALALYGNLQKVPASFYEVFRTGNFILYQRNSLSEKERVNRQYFTERGYDIFLDIDN